MFIQILRSPNHQIYWCNSWYSRHSNSWYSRHSNSWYSRPSNSWYSRHSWYIRHSNRSAGACSGSVSTWAKDTVGPLSIKTRRRILNRKHPAICLAVTSLPTPKAFVHTVRTELHLIPASMRPCAWFWPLIFFAIVGAISSKNPWFHPFFP